MNTITLTNPRTGETFTADLVNAITPKVLHQVVPIIPKWKDPHLQLRQMALNYQKNPDVVKITFRKTLEAQGQSEEAIAVAFSQLEYMNKVGVNKGNIAELEEMFGLKPDIAGMSDTLNAAIGILKAVVKHVDGIVMDDDFWSEQPDIRGMLETADYFREKISGVALSN